MDVLNQPVLVLNANWQPITPKNVKEAFVAMNGGLKGNNPPALAFDQEFVVDADGNVDWSTEVYSCPVSWDAWVNLPIRSYDLVVHTGSKSIRAPRILLQPSYSKMPMITPKPTKEAIRRRDGGICQYSGDLLTWKEGNIDHVVPVAQGGKSTFENMVWSRVKINSEKADRTPQQAGLRLLRKPTAPKGTPLSATQTVAHHPSWVNYMVHVTEVRGHKN